MSPKPTPGLSRRTFLHGSAVSMTASLALGARAGRTDDVLTVGLIGCGGRGTGAALQAMLAENGTVRVTHMADLFADRMESSLAGLEQSLAEDQKDRLAVPPENRFLGFDAWEQVIASDVDVVILTTPPVFRPAMLTAAINAGKHVFCEKPMAVDAPGVRQVLAAAEVAKQKQLSLVAGFCWRYHTRHRAIYKRIHEGAIGDVRAVYATYNTGPNGYHTRKPEWSDMEYQIRNWFHILWLSGDHVQEQACHSLDKIAWAMQDVSPLSCVAVGGRQVREQGNCYDHFSATFDYPDDVKGFLMCRQMDGCAADNSDHIWGTKGTAHVGWTQHEITGENEWYYEHDEAGPPEVGMYQREHDELFASIRSGKPINDGIWMSHSTLLGIMVRKAAYTGQVVTWEQIMNDEERLGPDSYALGPVKLAEVAMPGPVSHNAPPVEDQTRATR